MEGTPQVDKRCRSGHTRVNSRYFNIFNMIYFIVSIATAGRRGQRPALGSWDEQHSQMSRRADAPLGQFVGSLANLLANSLAQALLPPSRCR